MLPPHSNLIRDELKGTECPSKQIEAKFLLTSKQWEPTRSPDRPPLRADRPTVEGKDGQEEDEDDGGWPATSPPEKDLVEAACSSSAPEACASTAINGPGLWESGWLCPLRFWAWAQLPRIVVSHEAIHDAFL